MNDTDNWAAGNELTEANEAAHYDAHHVEWELEQERDALLVQVAALRNELADAIQIAVMRGLSLGYTDTDTDWIVRWEELGGEPW